MKKEQLLEQYVQLARKLGKLPSQREIKKFIADPETMRRHFGGSLANLKKQALEKYPHLEELEVPVEFNKIDLESYKLDLEHRRITKEKVVVTKNAVMLDHISKFAEKIFSGKVTPHSAGKKSDKKVSRALNLTLSDLHFGADIKRQETGYLDYGPQEEARRFAEVIKQTIEYKPHYRDETVLHVNLLGDIIQHKLHDPQDAAPISEQICRAIHLLSQGFSQLAENFKEVHVHCATGNHGRDLNRHKERATSGKWDSVETVIYYAIKYNLKRYTNMSFEIPRTPFVMYEVLGHKVFATHGDNVLKPGNPGQNLKIGAIENQINRFNASFKDKDEVKVAIVGHTHCASVSNLSSGAVLLTNGCLPPSDQYAVSLGILENKASQTLFEMTSEHALGDLRFIRVGEKQDKDRDLEKIIAPWTSF